MLPRSYLGDRQETMDDRARGTAGTSASGEPDWGTD
jgi:hypothetical protein